MDNAEREICRLCLKYIHDQNFALIEEVTLKVLRVLSIEMALSAVGRCLMCRDCQRDIERCFNFKAACLYFEDSISEFITEDSKLDLKEVYLIKNVNQPSKTIPRCHRICRLCMKITESGKYLNDTDELMASANDKLHKYISELNLNAVIDPVVCDGCLLDLQSYSEFVTGCFDVEKKINRYCAAHGIDKTQVHLYDVVQYVLNEALDCHVIQNVGHGSREAFDMDQSGNAFNRMEPNIKTEKIELKAEVNNESYFPNDSRQDKQFLPRAVKWENDEENHSKSSTKHDYIAGSVPHIEEIYIKTEEIEIKEDGNSSNPKHHESHVNHPRSKSQFKRKRNGKKETTNGTFFCEKCSIGYSTQQILTRHKSTVHGELPQARTYECNLCTFRTKYKHSLAQHELSHKSFSETEIYMCPICPFKTKYKHNLKGHLQIHTVNRYSLSYESNPEVQLYRCALCPYQTMDKRHLKGHVLIHKPKSELPTYDCLQCPYKAKRKGHLHRHMMNHKTMNEVITYQCDACDFLTKHKSSLSRHLLVHKEPIIYTCKQCSFQTNCDSTFRKHSSIHLDSSKLKQCKLCRYQSTSKYKFQRHSLTHKNKQEPVAVHKCTHCAYETLFKWVLKTHLRIHNDQSLGEVPSLKCLHCSYETTNKGNLIIHVHTHRNSSGMQLYNCDTCDGKYNKGYLTIHKRKCHGTEDIL